MNVQELIDKLSELSDRTLTVVVNAEGEFWELDNFRVKDNCHYNPANEETAEGTCVVL